MSVDQSGLRSRRAILASALGGLGAVVAAKLANPVGVSADPGDPVLVDAAHLGAGTTSVSSSTTAAAIAGDSTLGTGVRGDSTAATPSESGFVDPSDRAGVIGVGGSAVDKAPNTDETGVYGFSNISEGSTGVWGDSFIGTGVYGVGVTGVFGQGDAGVVGDGNYGVYGFGRQGVTGHAVTGETGVYGFVGSATAVPPVPPVNTAVRAYSASSTYVALDVFGKAKFSRSARIAISANTSSKKITMAGVTTGSYIIATLQTRRTGVYVHAVVPAAGSFTIYLNKAVTATTYVGYLVIN